MNMRTPRLAHTPRTEGRRNEAWLARARCAIEYGPRFDQEPAIVQIGCCRQCPVLVECLDYALRTETALRSGNHSVNPIYGGLTYDQRSQLKRAAG